MAKAGTYEVLFELASGGMGTIELAVAKGAAGVERLVAIKRILAHLTSSPEVVSRFLDEARIISRLHHANVVGLHQVAEDKRGYFLVFDYVEGETLGGLIDLALVRDERVPLPIVLRVVLDGLNGLNAAHEAKDSKGESLQILHRDVSRQNLIVGSDGVTRLSDFGISKSALHSTVTNQNYIAGKLIYMPPEYLNRAAIDRRMDIYAMGVTLWVAFAGQEPWSDETDVQTLKHIMEDGIPLLSAVGVSAPAGIETIIARACQADPANRFPTARHMINALEAFGRSEGSIASQVEVAEYVQMMAGGLLDERRRIIAERLVARGKPILSTEPPPPGSEDDLESAAAPKGASTLVYGGGAPPENTSVPEATGRKRYVAAALVGVGMIAGIAIAAAQSSTSAPVLAPSSLAPSSLTPSSVAPPPMHRASEPVEPETPEAGAREPSVGSMPAPPASAEPTKAALPKSKRSSTSTPGLPNQISTANPYR